MRSRVAALLLLALLAPTASAMPVGLDARGAPTAAAEGARPGFATHWAGAWSVGDGWRGLEADLAAARATGAVPLVHWYYWGDSISPACVERGCAERAAWEWEALTGALALRLRDAMHGARVVVVLENEFNKNGIEREEFAPRFDAMLAARAAQLRAVPGVEVALGFGGWGEGEWGRFPAALAATDHVGFQIMRAATRDSEESYRAAPDRVDALLDAAREVAPGKRALLYDLALSSWPDASGESMQAETLAAMMARRASWESRGLAGIAYRELRDNPAMGDWNYFGEAEKSWGLVREDGSPKPAWKAWKAT